MKNEEFATAVRSFQTNTIVRRKNTIWSVLCAAFFILHSSFFISGCARMGNPDGGWYDDTPPQVVGASPAEGATGVKSRKIQIHFNEYINLEDPQSKVIVSPPQIEQAEIRASGKRILIELMDSLKENTTYTVDFSDAITDKNENNPMGNYTYSFSTGSQIDTLEVSGYCLNAADLEPIKGILVGLYPVDSVESKVDSVGLFHRSPFLRVSRTNGSGRFTIKGVAPGSYYAYALQDADGDFVFSQKSEMVGYSHKEIVPTWKPDTRQDTIWIDSLHIDNILQVPFTHFLPDDVTLLCFQEPQTDRFLLKTERKDPEKVSFFFTYGSDSLPKLRGLNFNADSAFVIEASEKLDTLHYWLRDTALINQDTLQIELTYMMTDSTGILIEKTDTIEALPKMSYEKRMKAQEKEFEKWQKEQEKKKKHNEAYDSVMPRKHLEMKITPGSQMTPLQRIKIEVPVPLARCDTSVLHLYSQIDTVWYNAPYTFRQLTPRTFEITADWREGVEYSLEADSAAFESIYGVVSKALKQGIKVLTAEQFSTLNITVGGVPDSVDVIVELLSSDDKPVARAKTDADRSVEFLYLKAGTYYVRAFEDWNHNGIWDTGCYDQDLQAEPVYYNDEAIECKEKWDVSRAWNLTAKPRYKQKPPKITKQKPDKEKQLKNRNVERAKEKGIEYLKDKGVRI